MFGSLTVKQEGGGAFLQCGDGGVEGLGSEHDAQRRAWATVNAQTGGGNKPGGSGRGVRDTSSGSMSSAERSRAAKKGWATRRREGNG